MGTPHDNETKVMRGAPRKYKRLPEHIRRFIEEHEKKRWEKNGTLFIAMPYWVWKQVREMSKERS